MKDAADENHEPVALPKKRLSTGCLALLMVGGSLAVLLLGAVTVGLVWRSQQYHAIDQERERLASLGKPLTLAELDASYRVQLDQHDATPEWLAALALFQSSGAKQDLGTLTFSPAGKYVAVKDVPVADRIAYLHKYDSVFDEVRKATTAGTNVRYPVDLKVGINESSMNVWLEFENGLRGVTPIIELRFAQALADRDADLAIDAVEQILAAGETLATKPMLAPQLIRLAILQNGMAWAETLLAELNLTAEQSARLESLVANLDIRAGLAPVIDGERVHFMTTVRGEQRFDAESEKSLGVMLQSPTIVADERIAMALFADMDVAAQEPRELDLLLGFDRVGEDLLRQLDENLIPPLIASQLGILSRMMRQAFVGAETRRRLLLAGIAAERFRARTDQLPQTWQELTDDLPDGVPLDPFTSQPLRLKVITDPAGPPRAADIRHRS